MPAAKYVSTRTDGTHIGKDVREMVRLMIEEGLTWQRAADAVGIKRSSAYRALHKPHVIAHRRDQRKQQIELLSMRVPTKLSTLMDSENAAAAVRAALALEQLSTESRAEPVQRIQTGGIVIVLGTAAQRALPTTMPALELAAASDASDARK